MIKHEIRLTVREPAVWVTCFFLAAVIAYAVAAGDGWLRAKQQQQRLATTESVEALAEAREQSASGKEVEPWAVSTTHVSLTFNSLAALAVGQADLGNDVHEISTMSRPRRMSSRYGFENPMNLLAGPFDLAFVAVFLLPIFVLALSFDVISAERESGRLALIQSQPVSVARVAIVRLILRNGLLMSAAAGSAVLSCFVFGVDLTAGFWLGAALTALYAAFWITLALAVNSLRTSSAFNAVVLASTWLAIVFIIPALLNVGVQAAYPPPARVELINALRHDVIEYRQDNTSFMNSFLADHPEFADASIDQNFNTLFFMMQRELDKRAAPIEARFDEQLSKQRAAVRLFSVLSPALLLQETLTRIAGTNGDRFQQFEKQALEFNDEWTRFLGKKVLNGERLTESDLALLPVFRFQEGRQSLSLIWLVQGLVVCGLLALATRRLQR